MFRDIRKLLLTVGLALVLLMSAAVGAQASPRNAEPVLGTEAGTLDGCNWTGCGTAVNSTGRGFHVTLQWGDPWSDYRWVAPWSSVGGNGVDVDGIYVGAGCRMAGQIVGRIPPYSFTFTWGPGWHKILTNETAIVGLHIC